LSIRSRSDARSQRAAIDHRTAATGSIRLASSPTATCAFGVGFGDGRKATNLTQRWDLEDGPPPVPPTLRLVRWEGYDLLSQEVDLWVWGLPPPGPLAFVCEWPARHIPETQAEIDASLVVEAVARAVAIWPDELIEEAGVLPTR
jgi:hypothetical protein